MHKVLPVIVLFSLIASNACLAETESTCHGATEKGSLENGWQLPGAGENFQAYSRAGVLMGRNYVHSRVYAVVLDAYESLAQSAPGKKFVYGETGWAKGGSFKPHKTHQNGLSVDFFVPVLNPEGRSVPLPTSPFNKFGYGLEFDAHGRFGDFAIDYEAMAAHLLAVKAAADRHGIRIRRVIFDNDLQTLLFQTAQGARLQAELTFSKKKPWVRHDEHYHVDFIVPCQ